MLIKSSRLLASYVLTLVLLSGSHTVFAKGDIDVSYRYWKPSLNDKVGPVAIGGMKVDWIDAKQQLGIVDHGIDNLRLTWHLDEKSKIQIDSFNDSFNGTATPNFSFNGFNVSAGTFKTNVDVKDLQVVWAKYTNEYGGGDSRRGFMLGLKSVRINVLSNQIGGPAQVTKNFNLTFPTAGVMFETGRKGPINGFASLSGSYLSTDKYFYDAEIGAKTFVDKKKTLSVTAGYRYMKIKSEQSAWSKLNITMHGPFFGIEKKF